VQPGFVMAEHGLYPFRVWPEKQSVMNESGAGSNQEALCDLCHHIFPSSQSEEGPW